MMKVIADTEIHVDMAELAICEILRENGTRVPIKSLWEKNPAIFVFVRHFACEACRRHAVEVWQMRDQYQKNGAQVHFIGNGAPHFLQVFVQTYGLQEASFYTDPTLRTFKAAGFRKGFWIDPGTMHTRPEFLLKAIRFARRQENSGYGNIWQLGGVLVVKPGGISTYQFTGLTMDHFPPATDIPKMTAK